jgi:hypothetical protein
VARSKPHPSKGAFTATAEFKATIVVTSNAPFAGCDYDREHRTVTEPEVSV